MEVEEYIASGILELYVAGVLSEEENAEVDAMLQNHPEIKTEVEAIEKTFMKISTEEASLSLSESYRRLISRLDLEADDKVIPLPHRKPAWQRYGSWAAVIVLGAGLFWTYQNNSELRTDIKTAEEEKTKIQNEINILKADLEQTKDLLAVIRDKNNIQVDLAGQAVYPDAFVKVYWDQEDEKVYLDVQGLPEPPEGMEYQVWSLKLDPLTPTSLGMLSNFANDTNKIYTLENPEASEAFGITLEPEGGSPSPNLEQLYTLGAVESTP